MKIKVSEIPPQGLDLDLTKPRDWMRIYMKGHREEAFDFETPLAVHVHVERREEEVWLEGSLSGKLHLRCVRCLTDYPFALESRFSHTYLPLPEGGHREEHALKHDEMEEEFYRNDELEPDEVIASQVAEEMPAYPLCSEGCQGLCARCGANLNLGACSCPREEPLTPMGAALARLKGVRH